jgi:adenylate kinase
MISIDSKVTATIALEAEWNFDSTLARKRKTSGRIDDQDEDKIRNRYQEYNEKTANAVHDQGSFMP